MWEIPCCLPEPGEVQWVEGEQEMVYVIQRTVGNVRPSRQSEMSVYPKRPPGLGWDEEDAGRSQMGKTF